MSTQKVGTICIVRDYTSIEEESHVITILANDGEVLANRCFLRSSSSVIRRSLTHNEKGEVLDLQDYSIEVINLLLKLIYIGKLETSTKLMEEVIDLTKDLEINVTQSVPVQAPKAPEALIKNEDPGVLVSKDGKYTCGLCFKNYATKSTAETHYQEIHMSSKEKTIECLLPDCNKKFALMRHMKLHMKRMHNVSGTLMKPAKKVKSMSKSQRSIKKEPLEHTEQ